MNIVFRKLGPVELPAAGELLLWLDEDRPEREALAEYVFEKGVAELPRGAGEVQTLVVNTFPTLDDMLAALFAEELLAGRALAPKSASFASYTKLKRKGFTPGAVPLDESLEGIFLATLNADRDDDLTKPKVADRFVKGWRQMARIILEAAVSNRDPFKTPLFADREEFAELRARLGKDREQFREDMLPPRGEQWLVDIPGEGRGRALVLRRPKSLMFPQWSRREKDANKRALFKLLIVDWGQGRWIISTDPAKKVRLDGLAEFMRKAEGVADPLPPEKQPWALQYDGTLVSCWPTKLTAKNVIHALKRWCHARRLKPRIPLWSYALAAAVLLAASAAWAALHQFNPWKSATAAQTAAILKAAGGPVQGHDQLDEALTQAAQASVYLLVFKYPNGAEQQEATAWVVQPKGQGAKMLVTNAHVVALFDQTAKKHPGLQLMARPVDRSQDLIVQQPTCHPGFLAWRDLLARHGASGSQSALGTAAVDLCDVALLPVDDPRRLGPPLPLAETAQLQSLNPTNLAGFVGFLIDDVSPGLNLGLPGPFENFGYVLRTSDFFGSDQKDLSQDLLVQHSIPTTGGASGSPILSADGRVVAVHSANNYQFIAGSSERIVSGAQVHYAQRADLVQEMLDGSAEKMQTARTEQWIRILDQNADAVQFYQLISDWKGYAQTTMRATNPTELVNVRGKLSAAAPDDSVAPNKWRQSTVSFAVSGSGMLLAAAFTSPNSPKLAMTVYPVRDNAQYQEIKPSGPEGRHPAVQLEFDGPQQFDVVLSGDDNADYCLSVWSASLTSEQKRDALVAKWREQVLSGANSSPAQTADAHGRQAAATAPFPFPKFHDQLADDHGRFLWAKDFEVPPGNPQTVRQFFAIANALDGENIQLTVSKPQQNPAIAQNDTRAKPCDISSGSAWSNCQFTAHDGDRITLTVCGPNAGIPFDLVVYTLKAVAP